MTDPPLIKLHVTFPSFVNIIFLNNLK